MSARADPGAGVIAEITRRCPLSCAHCSTSSTWSGRDIDRGNVLRFFKTCTPEARPLFVSLTGGEPLMQPDLVTELTEVAHSVGTRVHVLTGGFFARSEPSPAVARALTAVDHVAFSLDAFHEDEVSRWRIFRAMRELIRLGQDVSLQVVGLDTADSYLDRLVADVNAEFGHGVPMLVSVVRSIGRATELEVGPSRSPDPLPLAVAAGQVEPCAMAAWPVICSDGRITACCNQDVVDGLPVDHLVVGTIAESSWPEVAHRLATDHKLKCIRTLGPRLLAKLDSRPSDGGYCQTCHELDSASEVSVGLADLAVRLSVGPDTARDRALSFSHRYGVPRFAELVALGAS